MRLAELDTDMQVARGIGDNSAPDMTETAAQTMRDLSAFMAEMPVIETHEQALAAKPYVDRGALCLKDLEAERDTHVRPLNEQVKKINLYYRGPREMLERVLNELQKRVNTFLKAETERREAAAEEARKKAEEAERVARDAEAAEQQGLADAALGELGVDIAQATQDADQAFADYEKASRVAAIAEKDSHVRLGGGFSRAIGLRTKEILIVSDAMKALAAIGVTDKISEAILAGARAYKKLHGRYPAGITVREERGI